MPQEFIHFDSESLVVKGKVENYIPSTFFVSIRRNAPFTL